MKRLQISSAIAVAAVGAWVLYTFAPAAYSFYPKCVFRSVTGLLCPGCGITRAAHHLLHGRFDEAFRLNPMLFVLLALLLYALPSIYRGQTPRFLMSPAFAWGSFVVLTSYWIVRNTAVWPY